MLDIIFILLFFLTILLMIYAIDERRIAFCLLCSIMWLILALLLLQGIEIPYQLYNATATEIQTGVQTIRTNLDPLSYLFMALGAIMFVITVSFMLEAFGDYRKMR